MNLAVIIVTFNRRALLERCLVAVAGQTRKPDRVFIIDNASDDGTHEWLNRWLPLNLPLGEVVKLSENLGGAGGFAAGMRVATDQGYEWMWMMDDDAEPHPHALEVLLERTLEPANIYCSAAVCGNTLSWPLIGDNARADETLFRTDQLPMQLEVRYAPFLGILVSAELVHRIGLPDAGFFIASDDTDYCYRAKRSGSKIILAGGSHIEHPASERYRLWLPGRLFYTLRLPPWKRYYDVRNRLFVAKNHFGLSAYYSTVPASFLRLAATLWYEPHRLRQIWAFVAGMIDGLLGRKGRRHERWGIRP